VPKRKYGFLKFLQGERNPKVIVSETSAIIATNQEVQWHIVGYILDEKGRKFG
jgi:hypothetical protein